MILTNEQIEQILDGSPDGATHIDLDDGQYEFYGDSTKCLSDLREILTLHQRIEELEAQLPKWISVEDELPPTGIWVLWLDGDKTMTPHCGEQHIDKINKRGECLVNYAHNYTHWMPLPEPPKEAS